MKTASCSSSRSNVIASNIANQLLATAGAMALIVQTGIVEGWTSPNVARLTSSAAANSTLQLSPTEASWLASSLAMGSVAATILLPLLVELAGTKTASLCSFAPAVVSWLLIMTAASSPWQLYVARFIAGISNTLANSFVPLYLAEVVASRHRGALISLAMVGWNWGSVASSVCETYLTWTASCAIYLVACLLGMLLFGWLLPESPYQLVKSDEPTKARESLEWYSGREDVDGTGMAEIRKFVDAGNDTTFAERIKQLALPANRRAVIIVAVVHAYPQLCGTSNVFYYMETILLNGDFSLIDPSQMVIYTNVILLLASYATVSLPDKLGRRAVLMASSAIMTTALLGLGLHYYLLANSTTTTTTSLQWLPIASIVALLVATNVGYLPVVSILLGEMFSEAVRSTAVVLASLAYACSAFLASAVYPYFVDALGEAWLFWTYAAVLATALPVFAHFLPETRGRSLREIQSFINDKSG